MFTHNQTIDLLKQLATKHLQIHSMGVGDYPNIAADDLLLYVDTSNDQRVIYPMLWLVPLSASIDGKETVVDYDVLILDLVQPDNSNLQEVLSDTLLIAHDVVALLQGPDITSGNYMINYPVDCTPLADYSDDATAGWSAKIAFRIQNLKDRCAPPMSSALSISTDTNP